MDKLPRNDDGTLESYAWPGGYQILYLAADGGVICSDCANSKDCVEADDWDKQWKIEAAFIHYEGSPECCENCNESFESAYGEVEE